MTTIYISTKNAYTWGEKKLPEETEWYQEKRMDASKLYRMIEIHHKEKTGTSLDKCQLPIISL